MQEIAFVVLDSKFPGGAGPRTPLGWLAPSAFAFCPPPPRNYDPGYATGYIPLKFSQTNDSFSTQAYISRLYVTFKTYPLKACRY